MFFWFLGMSFAAVLVVFSSPALDYRLVMAGSVLPVFERLIGGPWVLHTLTGSVVILTVVMLATQGQRLRRRQWLGVPIGLFMHLVLDASWADAELFWWPFLGVDDVFSSSSIPEFDRPIALIVVMEAAGLAVLAYFVRRLDLNGEGRELFLKSGQLLRSRVG